MSNKLTPLEAFYRTIERLQSGEPMIGRDYDLIESTLKKQQQEESAKSILEMEAPIIEPEPKNSKYIKADYTKSGTLVFTPTDDSREAVTLKELKKLMKG